MFMVRRCPGARLVPFGKGSGKSFGSRGFFTCSLNTHVLNSVG